MKFILLKLLFFVLFSSFLYCEDTKDNEIMVRIICINSNFSGNYTKNNESSQAFNSTGNNGTVYYTDIPLKKVNELSVEATASDDYSTDEIRIIGYIFEDNNYYLSSIQVDDTTGGDNAEITLEY
jgi:hypothetical protein